MFSFLLYLSSSEIVLQCKAFIRHIHVINYLYMYILLRDNKVAVIAYIEYMVESLIYMYNSQAFTKESN